MNHNQSLKIIFVKKDIPLLMLGIIFFMGLFVFYLLQGSSMAFVFFLFSALIFPLYFFVRSNKLFKKVYRLDVSNTPPRLYLEYWEKEKVKNLPNNCFWLERNKYTPFILDDKKEFKSISPFINGDTSITSGQLYRSLVQKATNLLMKPEKSDMMKAIETGALFLLTGGGALVIISLFGQINKGAEIATGS
tara:strand:- start:7853 stop:8425 length:573 start_codon:yes stop_codon:yes gene_type:complete